MCWVGRARDAPFVAPCFESERMFESNGDEDEDEDGLSDRQSPRGGRGDLEDDGRHGPTSPSGGGEKNNKKKFNFKQFMEKSKETIMHNVDQAKKIADRVILETKLTFVESLSHERCTALPRTATQPRCVD